VIQRTAAGDALLDDVITASSHPANKINIRKKRHQPESSTTWNPRVYRRLTTWTIAAERITIYCCRRQGPVNVCEYSWARVCERWLVVSSAIITWYQFSWFCIFKRWRVHGSFFAFCSASERYIGLLMSIFVPLPYLLCFSL